MSKNDRLRKNVKKMVQYQELADPLEKLMLAGAFTMYEFFHLNGLRISKKDWQKLTRNEKKILNRHGWVYAVYGVGSEPLYIGETGRELTTRFREHKNRKNTKDYKNWWKAWRNVKLLPCEEVTYRKFFESLMGIAGGYRRNKAQPVPDDDPLFMTLLGLIELESEVDESSKLLRDRAGKTVAFPIGAIKSNLILIKESIRSLS